jgi:acetyl-CoA synthetase
MSMLKKGDLYFPTKEFQKRAVISDPKIYQKALKDPIKFWEKLAKGIFWFEKWKKVFEHEPPYFKWFLGGKINITTNIFEKNKLGWRKIKNKPAIIWEPEPTNEKPKILTYEDLFKQVCKFANALKKLGVKKGDIVAIYLPMIPEVIVSMLSCARIGAVHLVVFSAFSPSALKTRLQISNAKVLITADGYFRRGKIINLKESADEGIKGTDVEKVIVVKRLEREIPWDEKRDIWFDELIKNESENCKPEIMDSEDPFFILPESGTTGEFLPILHTCGGYTVQAYWTGKWVFDFQEDSIFWSMGDVGWITGHTYTVYSSLLNGITTIIYEGAPDFPEKDRWAKIIEKHKVSIFYTSPTAIRMFRKLNGEITKKYDFKNLRVLGSVGEPIDSSSWLWYFKEIGKEKCPIVDTYWQTETGGIVISSLPGIGPFKPAFAGLPFPGIKVDMLDEKGNSCKVGERGNLVILPPFSPGMLRDLYKKPEKYKKVYWGKYGENIYFTSDGAFRDENGLIRIVGRVDDIIKIAGHRISTGELEDAVNSHEEIIESAVVGVPDEIKGEVPVIFAIYKGKKEKEEIKKEILEIIRKRIGPIAPPKEIYLVEDLPRTRSGKIVRKILRELMLGEEIKDLSALANPESVDKIKKLIKK